LEVLTKHERSDVALMMNLNDTYPSMGYMIQGAGNPEPATTIWELWNSDKEGPGMNSRNHIMFGSVGSWMYKALLGFGVGESYEQVLLGPDQSLVNFTGTTNVAGRTRTAHGTVSVSWTVGQQAICVEQGEGSDVVVSCDVGSLSNFRNVFYGRPTGDCINGFQANPNCNAQNASDKVLSMCDGKGSCTISVSNDFFGGDPCFGLPKEFVLQASCKDNPKFSLAIILPVGQSALVNVPIVASLGQTVDNIVVLEAGKTIWQNQKFVPGVPGIVGAQLNQRKSGIVFSVGSGSYNFQSK